MPVTTETTILERAARALAGRRASSSLPVCNDEMTEEQFVDWHWRDFAGEARTVLQAIREPSEEMIEAAEKIEFVRPVGEYNHEINLWGEEPGQIWQAMIDAALGDTAATPPQMAVPGLWSAENEYADQSADVMIALDRDSLGLSEDQQAAIMEVIEPIIRCIWDTAIKIGAGKPIE